MTLMDLLAQPPVLSYFAAEQRGIRSYLINYLRAVNNGCQGSYLPIPLLVVATLFL